MVDIAIMYLLAKMDTWHHKYDLTIANVDKYTFHSDFCGKPDPAKSRRGARGQCTSITF